MQSFARSAATAALLAAGASVADAGRSNPIRKVVTMLQGMQTKVAAEGKKEQGLYDKFMCYCEENRGALDQTIEAGQAKIEAYGSDVQAKAERKAQLAADLKEHKASRAAGEEAVAKAKALREKEAKEYAKVKSDSETNLAALKKAVAAIEHGTASSFLQSSAAGLVRTFAVERSEISDVSRQELVAFLSGGTGSDYAPASGEITGILKQMVDEMAKDLSEANDQEAGSQQNFEALLASKKKELSMLQSQIETKMDRFGDLGVELAETGNALENTKETLAEDVKFKAELEKGCSTKTKEWDEIKATRAEELVALGETIKVLGDDDALDLFKKTLPSQASSFLQVQVTAAATKARALQKLRAAAQQSRRPELDLLALALHGKKVGFDKVLGMIDEMSANLKAEQEDDDSKKEYCDAKLDEAEDRQKELKQSASDTEAAMSEMEGDIETLGEDVEALKAGIVALDKSVAEATEARKVDNAEYKELMSSNQMAKEVLGWAKNRLNKFYNPKMYKAAPKREEGEAAVQGGIAGTGIGASLLQTGARTLLGKGAPPPPPATFGAYTKKGGEESGGVLAMIDLLVQDLDKEMTEAKVMEQDAQGDYEKLMSDAGEKRAADSKALNEKEGARADAASALEEAKDKKEGLNKELMGNGKVMASLHGECDWLLKYFDTRKEARANEIESLTDAKAVLNGADYSLVQTASSSRRLRLRLPRA